MLRIICMNFSVCVCRDLCCGAYICVTNNSATIQGWICNLVLVPLHPLPHDRSRPFLPHSWISIDRVYILKPDNLKPIITKTWRVQLYERVNLTSIQVPTSNGTLLSLVWSDTKIPHDLLLGHWKWLVYSAIFFLFFSRQSDLFSACQPWGFLRLLHMPLVTSCYTMQSVSARLDILTSLF